MMMVGLWKKIRAGVVEFDFREFLGADVGHFGKNL